MHVFARWLRKVTCIDSCFGRKNKGKTLLK